MNSESHDSGPIQLRIKHTTGFTYETGAVASLNEARMVPLNTSDQYVLRSRLEIKPSPWSYEYTDYWGTNVMTFEVHEPHADLTVVATSTVETREPDDLADHLDWEALAEVQDEFCEYVAMTEWVAPHDELIAEVDRLRESSLSPTEFTESVIRLVHDRIAHRGGATEVSDPAADVWESGAGSCQDLTHVAVGALRQAGIPTRYVSGYLHPEAEPAVGESVAGESHAWLEVWDGEWIGFDPTHLIATGRRHVVVGRGRDYSDNPPLRGIYSTAGGSEMFVDVEITRLR